MGNGWVMLGNFWYRIFGGFYCEFVVVWSSKEGILPSKMGSLKDSCYKVNDCSGFRAAIALVRWLLQCVQPKNLQFFSIFHHPKMVVLFGDNMIYIANITI